MFLQTLMSTARSALRSPAPPPSPTVDEEAHAHLVAELRPAVRITVAGILRGGPEHPDVEDVTHEAMRRAIEGRSRLQGGEPLRPWLMGIARHVALDLLRSRRREQRRLADSPGASEDPLALLPSREPGPLARAEQAQALRRIEVALASLDAGPREALVCFHLHGLGYREIAERLGVPAATVATWISRSRRRIAQSLPGGHDA